jgi:hypothetical protein
MLDNFHLEEAAFAPTRIGLYFEYGFVQPVQNSASKGTIYRLIEYLISGHGLILTSCNTEALQ